MLNKFKKLYKLFLSLFPSKLPIGMTDFYLWSDSVLELSDVPNNSSTVFCLATMILHLPSTSDKKSKYYFIKSLNKYASNQIAAGVIQDLKQKQADAMRAEEEAKKNAVETTAVEA